MKKLFFKPILFIITRSSILVGGQAVLNGVMMRVPGAYSTSVRLKDGSIKSNPEPFKSINEKKGYSKIPILRGIIGLYEAMKIGYKTLNWSASIFEEDGGFDEEKLQNNPNFFKKTNEENENVDHDDTEFNAAEAPGYAPTGTSASQQRGEGHHVLDSTVGSEAMAMTGTSGGGDDKNEEASDVPSVELEDDRADHAVHRAQIEAGRSLEQQVVDDDLAREAAHELVQLADEPLHAIARRDDLTLKIVK